MPPSSIRKSSYFSCRNECWVCPWWTAAQQRAGVLLSIPRGGADAVDQNEFIAQLIGKERLLVESASCWLGVFHASHVSQARRLLLTGLHCQFTALPAANGTDLHRGMLAAVFLLSEICARSNERERVCVWCRSGLCDVCEGWLGAQ